MEAMMSQSQRLRTRVRIRNLTETLACILVALTFGGIARAAGQERDALGVLGGCLEVAGALYVTFCMWQRGSNTPLPKADAPTAEWLRSHRAELERQRSALHSVLSWYVLPLVPGVLVLMVAAARHAPADLSWPARVGLIAANLLFVGAVMGFVVWLNKRAARKLASLIAELDGPTE